MRAISTRDGTKRAGHIIIIMAGDDATGFARYVYRYSRGTGRARHDITITPSTGLLAVGALGDALSTIAVDAAEALDDGPIAWSLERVGDEWAVRMASDAERAA